MGIARVSRAVASWAGLRKPSGRLALRACAAGACHRLQREVHEDSTRRELGLGGRVAWGLLRFAGEIAKGGIGFLSGTSCDSFGGGVWLWIR